MPNLHLDPPTRRGNKAPTDYHPATSNWIFGKGPFSIFPLETILVLVRLEKNNFWSLYLGLSAESADLRQKRASIFGFFSFSEIGVRKVIKTNITVRFLSIN